MAYDDNNPFAKILRGEANAHRVYEDDMTLAFMDLMPQSDGHTLIVPKYPATDFLDLAPEYVGPLMQTTQMIARAVDAAFEPDGVMVIQLNRAGAGQTVFHLHFHVIPRFGGIDLTLHARTVADADTLAGFAERIKAHL